MHGTERSSEIQWLAQCQPGFEPLLQGEMERAGLQPLEQGSGWVSGGGDAVPPLGGWCFAHRVIAPQVVTIEGDSVNQLAARLAEHFLESVRGERITESWPLIFSAAAGADGLGRRMRAVEKAFVERVGRKLSRVARLAESDVPGGWGPSRGYYVLFTDFHRVCAGRDAWHGGQRRMADDPGAPSRSYLKIEEAYGVIGREPADRETVVDLGAAPGGWSFSAAKRGARVIAIDNGPMKGGALGHPGIVHRREDAFRFKPEPETVYDWLFCDLVEQPNHVMDLLREWITKRWCRRFVINLKFGRVDPLALLEQVRDPQRGLAGECGNFAARHLFHDREELTVVGEVK